MGDYTLRTNQLLVIAGPPCAGKTTLIAQIREGALPLLCGQLGLADPARWTFVDATELARMSQASTDRLAVHYDLIVQRSPQGYRYLPDMMGEAGSVVFLTVWTRPEVLRQRSRARLLEAASSLLRHPATPRGRMKRLRNIWRRHRIFRDAARVDQLYEEWFRFASRYPGAPHWIIDPSASAGVAEAFTGVHQRAPARPRV